MPGRTRKTADDLVAAAKQLPLAHRKQIKQLFAGGCFVSHTGDDTSFIRSEIMPVVREVYGFAHFFQNVQMPASSEYARVVGAALLACSDFLAVVSQHAVASRAMPAEIELATRRGLRMTACVLDDTRLETLHKWSARGFRRYSHRSRPVVIDFSRNPTSARALLTEHLRAKPRRCGNA